MIGLLSIFAPLVSMMVEETDEEAEARVLAEAQAYVAGLSDDEFEAWVVSMEKMGRFLEIAKIMRIEWLISRLESLLPIAESLSSNKIVSGYYTMTGFSHLPYENFINHGNIAYQFCIRIDGCKPHEDTRRVCCSNPMFARAYALHFDKHSRDDTREAACGACENAYEYAIFVDKQPCIMTRNAVVDSAHYLELYDEAFREDYESWYREHGLW